MKYAIVCSRPSAGAAALRRLLPSSRRVRRSSVSSLLNRYEHFICWGWAGVLPYNSKILNRDASIAVNKLAFFRAMPDGVRTPAWSTMKQHAQQWLDERHHGIVMCRTLLRSHSGKGIVVAREADEVVEAPLYTAYVPKQAEYRIHLASWHDGVFIQQKRKRDDTLPEEYSPLIRSYHHGWVYCARNVDPLAPEAIAMARLALLHSGLDFGAVDLILGKNDKAYVLEVNAAPALSSPSTQEFYRDSFGCL